ncbi:unnamed protein product [Gadus morhua 'NCC']
MSEHRPVQPHPDTLHLTLRSTFLFPVGIRLEKPSFLGLSTAQHLPSISACYKHEPHLLRQLTSPESGWGTELILLAERES